MTLSFSTTINKQPTYFPEKIIATYKDEPVTQELGKYIMSKYSSFNKIFEVQPKIHTIRKDLSNSWKVGNKIHFVINNRSKERLQFLETKVCTRVDNITLSYPNIYINGHTLSIDQHNRLAINDGFENLNEFWNYFLQNKFSGKLISWTDFTYDLGNCNNCSSKSCKDAGCAKNQTIDL